MESSAIIDADNVAAIKQRVDAQIVPWKWGVALAFYFPFSQFLSVLGSQNPGFESHVWIIFAMQALAGALLGTLLAYGARNIVKAIRC
jgi:hypothetical protein